MKFLAEPRLLKQSIEVKQTSSISNVLTSSPTSLST